MPNIAVFGGTGYLASIIKNQNNIKKNKFVFFSRKQKSKNYINYNSLQKSSTNFKKFDFIVNLLGPSQNQLKKNEELIKKKNKIIYDICDLCLKNNIKLIHISSMHVYESYGKKFISINSKINHKKLYSRSHYDSEKIIQRKFKKKKKNFYKILRIGNVFGFRKYENLKEINNNIVNKFCLSAIKNKKILIETGYIQRTFVPSQIFVQVINKEIKNKVIGKKIVNIFYKNLRLKDLAEIIKKRIKLNMNFEIDIKIKNFKDQNIFLINSKNKTKSKVLNNKFYNEIDQILKNIKIRLKN